MSTCHANFPRTDSDREMNSGISLAHPDFRVELWLLKSSNSTQLTHPSKKKPCHLLTSSHISNLSSASSTKRSRSSRQKLLRRSQQRQRNNSGRSSLGPQAQVRALFSALFPPYNFRRAFFFKKIIVACVNREGHTSTANTRRVLRVPSRDGRHATRAGIEEDIARCRSEEDYGCRRACLGRYHGGDDPRPT